MNLKELRRIACGHIIKSNCQWCGEKISTDPEKHKLYGNICRGCRHDFYEHSALRISSHELSARIAEKRSFPKHEIWQTQANTYIVNKKINKAYLL